MATNEMKQNKQIHTPRVDDNICSNLYSLINKSGYTSCFARIKYI